jgi:hypothetical protein
MPSGASGPYDSAITCQLLASSTMRFIPFNMLRAQIAKAGTLIKHLKPDFIEEMAESTELD